MKRREFYIGPGAASLILIIVVLSMSVLGLLALISARGDVRLSQRSRTYIAAEYEASAAAERSVAALDALLAAQSGAAETDADYLSAVRENLPEGMTMEGRRICWMQEGGIGRSLRCAVEIAPLSAYPRYTWKEHVFAIADDGLFLE